MKPLSGRALGVSPSPTVAMDARYKEMLARGLPVVSLGAGEPDLPMPEAGVTAAIQALREGRTRYAHMAGLPELRAALSRKFSTENGIAYTPEEILVTSGAKQAVFTALLAILDPGDEVLIPSPYWVTYPEAVRLAGGVPVVIETRMEDGFKLKAEDLLGAITSHSKLLILNSPCNPTGAVYSRSELEALAKVIVDKDLYLLSDEIYEHILFEAVRCTSPASLSPEMRARTATVNGFSKAFAMQGLRLGYVGAPTVWAKAMIAIQSHTVHHPSTVSQYAALGCLPASSEILPSLHVHYQKAKDYAVSRLKNIPGVTWNDPQGAFYIFLSVQSLLPARAGTRNIEGSLALAEYLLEECHLATVPGEGFGRAGYLRLSFANSLEDLKTAFDRLEQGLKALSSHV
jgi:aspartate aminotransferase